ncbi:tumor necrosis factor receptor superfamily member 10B-like isoform X2 [Myotis yumanensis]|uniref:tumor necrosis factor receptor superfamily member 10B-like isoform X2 n=1 Tax=Myotis yumanensis TaxID=159337 RepID=UPI0038D1A14C
MASRRAVGRAAAPEAQRGAGPRPWAPRTLIVVLSLLVLIPVASCPIIKPDRIHQQPAAPEKECPPGSYLPEHSRVCTPCPENEGFTGSRNRLSSCRPCSNCPADKVQIAACTRTNDTQCQCKKGTYQDKDSPEFCLLCDTRCPNGKVKARDCGPNNNLVCVDQKSGTPWWVTLLACIFGLGVLALLGTFVYCWCRSRNLTVSGVATKTRSRVSGFLQDLRHQGPIGTDESQMRRKLLVPANNENPIETLKECFYEFSRIVPFTRWEPFMRLVGLMENDISIAKAQVLDQRDALYHMLTIWLNTKGKAASVNTLLDSLDKLGETKAKEDMQDLLLQSGKYVYEVGEAGSAVSQ